MREKGEERIEAEKRGGRGDDKGGEVKWKGEDTRGEGRGGGGMIA